MLSKSDFINEFDFELFGKENGDYKKDGIVCEEEKDIIVFMLDEIKLRIYDKEIFLDSFENNTALDNTENLFVQNKDIDSEKNFIKSIIYYLLAIKIQSFEKGLEEFSKFGGKEWCDSIIETMPKYHPARVCYDNISLDSDEFDKMKSTALVKIAMYQMPIEGEGFSNINSELDVDNLAEFISNGFNENKVFEQVELHKFALRGNKEKCEFYLKIFEKYCKEDEYKKINELLNNIKNYADTNTINNKNQDSVEISLAIKQYYENEKQGKHKKLDNGSIVLEKDIFTTIEDEELGKITIMQDGYVIGKKVKIEECNYDYKIPVVFSGDNGFEIYAFNEAEDKIKENFKNNQDKYIRNIKKILISQKKIVKYIIKYAIELYEKIESNKWTNIDISVEVKIDKDDRAMLNVGFSFEEYDDDKFVDSEDGYIDVIFDCTTNNIEEGDYGWY